MRFRLFPLPFALAALISGPLHAQGGGATSMMNQMGAAPGKPQPAPPPEKVIPPPALPGAGNSAAVAPPSRVPLDMEPNDALFDAINRGDIGTARDALSRGADLHARNILGMTPLELSIDLGRNDISFMLLSMRAADDGSRPAQAGTQTATKAPPKQTRPTRVVAQPVPRVTQPAPAQTARLYSGDGGTPNPNAGFLGFDSSRR
jgi:hypothetical protein